MKSPKDDAGKVRSPLDWTLERQEQGPDLIIFRTRFDWLRNPRNGLMMRCVVLESVDWVNVVPVTRDGRAVMVNQYRFGIGATTLETPGGMIDAGEDSLMAARRELLEETGYGGGHWHYLGAVEPNPAVHDNVCHHWLADGVECLAEPTPGDGEAIGVELCTLEDLQQAVADGRLRHVLALSALSRVYPLWPLARARHGTA
jgi:ADP-ribose pyrophosphatase